MMRALPIQWRIFWVACCCTGNAAVRRMSCVATMVIPVIRLIPCICYILTPYFNIIQNGIEKKKLLQFLISLRKMVCRVGDGRGGGDKFVNNTLFFFRFSIFFNSIFCFSTVLTITFSSLQHLFHHQASTIKVIN